jgi:spore germination protein YaaH
MYMNKEKIYAIAVWGVLVVVISLFPLRTFAMEVGVWVPWFGAEAGAKSALKNISSIDVIYPFVYEVESDGSLVNRVDFSEKHWETLFTSAKEHDVKVIPTVAWFDGVSIHAVLNDSVSREAHIEAIVAMVEKHGFAGVNIDYEQKKSKTKDNFSQFLQELKDTLDGKLLTCAIEARTPPESLYREVPKDIEYANDYRAINKYCDRVEIMAYDQQRADITLNETRRGVPYMPVADKAWVEKVVKLALKDIDKDKLMLGVPTYGRAWDITVAPEWYKDYTKVASLNQPRIIELAKKYKVKNGRTAGGEATISYFPTDGAFKKLAKKKAPAGTPKGFEAVAVALKEATDKNKEVSVRFVTWSDAEAAKDKFSLIEKYNLKGTAIFKIDGEEDQKLWKQLKSL